MNLFSIYPRASNIRFGSASEETNDFASFFFLRRKSEIGFAIHCILTGIRSFIS